MRCQNYLSARWWRFQFEEPTWWRAVGLVYLGVAIGMVAIAAASLVCDACASIFFHRARGSIRAHMTRYGVRVWDPSQSRLKRAHSRLIAWRSTRQGLWQDEAARGVPLL